jgi:cyanophycinase
LEDKLEGNLIIIGGGEDKTGEKDILKEVCSKLDNEKEQLVIATIASGVPEELGSIYKNLFTELGVKNISVLDVENRCIANESSSIATIEKAGLVFFTGGDQLKITSLIGGTPLFREWLKDMRRVAYS